MADPADPPFPGEALPPWLAAPLAQLVGDEARLPQALLVHGPFGVGKGLLAAALAQSLLCEARPAGVATACGRCAACGWFSQGAHPDFRRIEPEADAKGDARADARAADDAEGSGAEAEPADARGTAAKPAAGSRAGRSIRIQQVQRLAEFFSVGGHRSSRRIVVIEPADAMNGPAANALLKTLEEPPAGAVLVLVTAHPSRLLATLRSRCRALAVGRPSHAHALQWLAATETVDAADAESLLAATGGAPLAAARLAQEARAAAHRTLLDAVQRIPETGLAEAADAVSGSDPVELVSLLQRWLVDVARVAAGASPLYHPGRQARLAQLAQRSSARGRAEADRRLVRQRALAEHPLNPRLFVEETLDGYARAFRPTDEDGR